MRYYSLTDIPEHGYNPFYPGRKGEMHLLCLMKIYLPGHSYGFLNEIIPGLYDSTPE
jgi:hypothetical protein